MGIYGNYIYESATQTLTKEDEAFEQLSAAGVKRAVERALTSEADKQAEARFHTETVPMFRKINPAYVDNDHNAKLLKNQWETTYDVTLPTYDQLEECYFTLRTAGVLNLNKTAVERESAQDIAVKADRLIAARKDAEFDLEAAESMSMEDLEARCRGWK